MEVIRKMSKTEKMSKNNQNFVEWQRLGTLHVRSAEPDSSRDFIWFKDESCMDRKKNISNC